VNPHASWWRRRWRGEVPTQVLPDRVGPDGAAGLLERPALHAALRADGALADLAPTGGNG